MTNTNEGRARNRHLSPNTPKHKCELAADLLEDRAKLREALEAVELARHTDATEDWQPHERNYSGGRVGVWFSNEWTTLRVEAGVANATMSIREHEAYDLAQRLSPPLVKRMEYLFAEMKKAQHALHQFTWADTIAPLLRKVADEWDCDSSQCEFASGNMGGLSCPCMEDERGCKAVEADELRQFADALEIAAALRTQAQSSTSTKGED